MASRTALSALAAASAVVVLAGCASGPGYADLAGEPASDRSLADDLGAVSLEEGDLSDARWIGEHEGTDLWLFAGAESGEACLLANPAEGSWTSSCGETFALGGVDGYEYVLLPDGETYDRPVSAISENVFVVD